MKPETAKISKDVLLLVIRELKPYKRTVIFCSLLALTAAVLDMAGPILLGRSFDLAADRRTFLVVAGAAGAWFVLRSLAESIRLYVSYRGSLISVSLATGLMRQHFSSLLRKPLSFHYEKKSQERADKVQYLRWDLESFIEESLFDLLPALLTIAAILGYLYWLVWPVALALSISLAAYILFTGTFAPTWMARQRKTREADHAMTSVAWDTIRNILVVKSTTSERATDAALEKQRAGLIAESGDLGLFRLKMFNAQTLIAGAGSLAAVMIALERFRGGAMSLGELTTVTAFAFTMFGYVRHLQMNFRIFLKVTASYAAVLEAIEVPAEDLEGGTPMEVAGDVEFREIRFRYREDKPTLENVSFSARRGERIAIVGESGEGKTTLVDLLGRYYEPQSGSILIDGRDIREINLRSLREQTAYVPQDLTLFHDTIGMNIRFGRHDATDEEVHEAARLAHLADFIEGLPEKYDTMVGERGLKLSGGERQRVALARAFLRNPKILILDEPTAHLDSKTEEFIRSALEKLMAGRTTFIIAHRLRTVMDADRILALKDGRILESGTHEELLEKDGTYAALLKAQRGYITPDEKHLGT